MNKEPDKTPWHQKTWAQLLLIISAVVTGVVTLLAWLKIDLDTVSPILRRVVSSLEPYKIYLGAFFLLLVGVWQRDRLLRWYHQAGQLLRSIYIRTLARILRPVFTESSSTIHYGCRVRFRHFTTGKYLTSLAGLFYTHQGGSTQQIVFGASIPDENSIWILQSPHGSNPDSRLNQDMKFGDVVRIYHEVSGQYLHSHSARSPCSPPPPAADFQREVTVSFQHNAHDNWTIRSLAKLLTGAELRFEHADGGQFLHSHDRLYGVNGRSNSFEVTCCCDDNEDGSWILSNASSGLNGGLITTCLLYTSDAA